VEKDHGKTSLKCQLTHFLFWMVKNVYSVYSCTCKSFTVTILYCLSGSRRTSWMVCLCVVEQV